MGQLPSRLCFPGPGADSFALLHFRPSSGQKVPAQSVTTWLMLLFWIIHLALTAAWFHGVLDGENGS
jgi:hypothetical protein